MAKTLKLAFIGAGGIARTQADRLAKQQCPVEIVAIADPSAAALDLFGDTYQVPPEKRFKDWKKVVADKSVDAVSVCTPNKLHCGPTVAALKAGKHVLLEKPMAMNAKEAKEMCAAAKKARKVLQIAFQHRFNANAQFIKRQIDDGILGDILYIRCQALRRRGIPSWGVFGRKELQGGGPMIDIGVHILEVAHYLAGKPKLVTARGACHTYLGDKKPAAMCHQGGWDWKTYTVEDLAVGFLGFANGLSITVESSFAAHIENDVWNLQIMGSKGGAILNPLTLIHDQNGYMMNMTPACVGNQDGFDYKMKHFVECCLEGKKCEAPGEDGLAVQQMLDGVYESARRGREVQVK